MNPVEEVLLELELVQVSLGQLHLKVDSVNPYMSLLRLLVDTMIMTLRDTISRDSLETIRQINDGGMTSIKD